MGLQMAVTSLVLFSFSLYQRERAPAEKTQPDRNRKIQHRRARRTRPAVKLHNKPASQQPSSGSRLKAEKIELQISLAEQHFNLPACHCGTRCAAFQKHTDSATLSC